MKVFDSYNEARNELLYRPGGFTGSFLWMAKCGVVKAATFDAYTAFFFVPNREVARG